MYSLQTSLKLGLNSLKKYYKKAAREILPDTRIPALTMVETICSRLSVKLLKPTSAELNYKPPAIAIKNQILWHKV